MLLAQLDLAAWVGIGVAGAPAPEHGDRAGVLLLDERLRVAGVVAGPLVAIQSGVVAGVTKHHRTQLAISAVDPQHRHAVIDRAFWIPADNHAFFRELTPIDREMRLALADC